MSTPQDTDGWQKRIEASLNGLSDFSSLVGKSPIEEMLELAVMTLVRFKYRGVEQWRVHQVYSFTSEGIQQKTFVESWGGSDTSRFTPTEVILIARHLSEQNGGLP